MTLAYATKLNLIVQKTSVEAHKIDGLSLEIFSIVVASFLLKNSQDKDQFFPKTFLLGDTSMEVILGMLFWSSAIQIFSFVMKSLLAGFTPL